MHFSDILPKVFRLTTKCHSLSLLEFIGRRLLEAPSDGKEPNCTMPAIVSFPRTLFTEAQREKGAIIIDFLVAFYLCGAISYVCFVYFVPSLQIISKGKYAGFVLYRGKYYKDIRKHLLETLKMGQGWTFSDKSV